LEELTSQRFFFLWFLHKGWYLKTEKRRAKKHPFSLSPSLATFFYIIESEEFFTKHILAHGGKKCLLMIKHISLEK
jgi:hypothetical protein